MIPKLTPEEYGKAKDLTLMVMLGWLIGTVLLKWAYDEPATVGQLCWNFASALTGLVTGILIGIGIGRWYSQER